MQDKLVLSGVTTAFVMTALEIYSDHAIQPFNILALGIYVLGLLTATLLMLCFCFHVLDV